MMVVNAFPSASNNAGRVKLAGTPARFRTALEIEIDTTEHAKNAPAGNGGPDSW
ncbi:MAG: hypothetical protein ACYDGN_06835 [Acidimicrobiales bacterium]